MGRVVWEMATFTLEVDSTSALTRLVFPAPDGAATTNGLPVFLLNDLLQILDLLSHLFNNDFQIDGLQGSICHTCLRGQGICLSI